MNHIETLKSLKESIQHAMEELLAEKPWRHPGDCQKIVDRDEAKIAALAAAIADMERMEWQEKHGVSLDAYFNFGSQEWRKCDRSDARWSFREAIDAARREA